MRHAIRTHLRDFIGDRRPGRVGDRHRGVHPRAPAGVHIRPQLLPGEGGLRRRVSGDGRPGAVGDDRRRRGRIDRRRPAGARPGRGDDGHLQAYAPVYRNATVLLRPRTPLKDMYLALDPGNAPVPAAIPDGGTLGIASTQPDIDVDQILSSLDADTRTYLLLLLSGGARRSTARAPRPAAPALPLQPLWPLISSTSRRSIAAL